MTPPPVGITLAMRSISRDRTMVTQLYRNISTTISSLSPRETKGSATGRNNPWAWADSTVPAQGAGLFNRCNMSGSMAGYHREPALVPSSKTYGSNGPCQFRCTDCRGKRLTTASRQQARNPVRAILQLGFFACQDEPIFKERSCRCRSLGDCLILHCSSSGRDRSFLQYEVVKKCPRWMTHRGLKEIQFLPGGRVPCGRCCLRRYVRRLLVVFV